MLTKAQINQLKNPLEVIWNYIYPDAEEFVSNNEECIEMCIDADRLYTHGFEDTQDMVRDLIKEHGYPKVLKAISDNIQVY